MGFMYCLDGIYVLFGRDHMRPAYCLDETHVGLAYGLVGTHVAPPYCLGETHVRPCSLYVGPILFLVPKYSKKNIIHPISFTHRILFIIVSFW